MKSKYFTLCFLSLLMALCKSAFAHDPGLSYAKLDIQEHELTLQLSFAQVDIKHLLKNKYDNHQEPEAIKNRLISVIKNGIRLKAGDRPLPTADMDVFFEPNDSVNINLTYATPHQGEPSLHMPLLESLPRGHRQYLVITNKNQSNQYILSAESQPLIIPINRVLVDRTGTLSGHE